jgi:cell division protein FtsW (lipid II flippase)
MRATRDSRRLSYGGSSVLTMMTAMGLLISINARRRVH